MLNFVSENFYFLAVASLTAGFVDAVVGGGGLVQTPALFTAFPNEVPATLFGTNKLSSLGGTFVAASRYLNKVQIRYRFLMIACAAALIGSFLGAWTVTQVSPKYIRNALPFVLIVLLCITIAKKNIGLIHQPRVSGFACELGVFLGSGAIGFYDGFFGPGTGTFFIFLFVYFFGFDFLHSSATAKLLNAVTNTAALILFIPTGHIYWHLGLGLMAFNMIGGVLGSSLALAKGSSLVRYFFIVVVLMLIIKTANDTYHLIPQLQ